MLSLRFSLTCSADDVVKILKATVKIRGNPLLRFLSMIQNLLRYAGASRRFVSRNMISAIHRHANKRLNILVIVLNKYKIIFHFFQKKNVKNITSSYPT